MAVGLAGVRHWLYQPGVVAVFHWSSHILGMCPFRDCCWGRGGWSVTLPGCCWELQCTVPICKMFAHVPGVLEILFVSSLIHQHCLKVSGCYLLDLGSAAARSGKPTRAEEPGAGANTIWQADNADGSQQTLNSGAVVWQHTKFESVTCIAEPHVSQPHGLEYWSTVNWLLVQIHATLIF